MQRMLDLDNPGSRLHFELSRSPRRSLVEGRPSCFYLYLTRPRIRISSLIKHNKYKSFPFLTNAARRRARCKQSQHRRTHITYSLWPMVAPMDNREQFSFDDSLSVDPNPFSHPLSWNFW